MFGNPAYPFPPFALFRSPGEIHGQLLENSSPAHKHDPVPRHASSEASRRRRDPHSRTHHRDAPRSLIDWWNHACLLFPKR